MARASVVRRRCAAPPTRPETTLSQNRGQRQIVCFNFLELYHRSPDSGERQYKSRSKKKGV